MEYIELNIPVTGTGEVLADPEDRNPERADWAAQALAVFQAITGVDNEDVICDLLTNLMHLAHNRSEDFSTQLRRALDHFDYETSATYYEGEGEDAIDTTSVPTYADLLAYAEQAALLVKDGEVNPDDPDAGEWDMPNDDAFDTLHILISKARVLTGKEG